jgi:predicted nucleotidyltransferase component of viral defense system
MELEAATLRSVQEHFGLPSPALVEKDFYVVKALAAIDAVETKALHLRLVFGGGTALSRAHRLIRRMSEDIDLRIVVESNRVSRGTLRRLRAQITDALLRPDKIRIGVRTRAARSRRNTSYLSISGSCRSRMIMS